MYVFLHVDVVRFEFIVSFYLNGWDGSVVVAIVMPFYLLLLLQLLPLFR